MQWLEGKDRRVQTRSGEPGVRRAILPALVALASLAGAGCAITGKRAAEGATTSLREGQQATEGETTAPALVAGRRVARGATQELSSPESLASIGAAVDAAVDRGLARVHRQLANGEGPLARDLDATVERASAAAIRGVDQQLDELLGGCDGLDRRECLRREVRALGQEASTGFVNGLLGSRRMAVFIVFLAGIGAALVGRAVWDRFAVGLHRTRQA